MRNIHIGCCGFPRSRSEYFHTLKVVEIQQTFYQPPALKTAERWRAEAPADFEFTLKAWQLITHEPKSPTYRRLKLSWPHDRLEKCGSFRPTEEVQWAWERTREIARALRSRYIVFQCPSGFRPTGENRKNLESFFRSVKREELQLVWEPRGMWTAEEVRDLCRELDLIHCVDPFKADPQWGRVRYFRIHGITGYRYRFSEMDLKELLERSQGVTYCLFNNTNMWVDALAFLRLVKGPRHSPPQMLI